MAHAYTCKNKWIFVLMFMSYTGVQFFSLVMSLLCFALQVVLASKNMLGSVLYSEMEKKIKLGFSHNTQCFCELQMLEEFTHTPASNPSASDLSRVSSDSGQMWHCLLGDSQITQVGDSVPNIPFLVQMPSPSLFYQGFQQTSCKAPVSVFFFFFYWYDKIPGLKRWLSN